MDDEVERSATASDLRPKAVALAAAVAAITPVEDTERRSWGRRRWRWMGLWMGIGMAGIAGLIMTAPDPHEGPWRGAIYPHADLRGSPIMGRYSELRFDWGRRSPERGVPADGFSGRWDTCLVLDEALSLVVQVISDEGARLWVDDRLVVDDWSPHRTRSRGAEVPLGVGAHHIRVEYFDQQGPAVLELRASLWGEPPAPLPLRNLRYPDAAADAPRPCPTSAVP